MVIISNSVSKVRNAIMAKHRMVSVEFSKKNFSLIQLLTVEGFFSNCIVENHETNEVLYDFKQNKQFNIYTKGSMDKFLPHLAKIHILIELRYVVSKSTKQMISAIQEMKVISKPSLRKCQKADELKKMPYKNNMGVVIVSTNQGMMTDKKAINLNIGGERILEIF